MTNAPAPTMIPQWTLGDRLDKALHHGGVSVHEMAEHLGVSRNTVGNYIAGRTVPRRGVILQWAFACRVDPDWLLTGEVDDHHDGDDGPGSEVRTGSFATVAALDDYRRTGVELAPTGTG